MTSPSTIDLDDYIAALPVRPISPPRFRVPKRYQTSSYPLLKNFNGFSGEERRRGGQLGVWLIAAGCITLPYRCDICASTGPLGEHGESYYHIGRCPALCRSCHRALHFRTFQWDAWRRLVDANAVTGKEWFALAPRHGLDLAQHLRDKFGWRAADIERSPLSPLPEAIAVLLPDNMLDHPNL
ncbi:MAG: hypothetical protein B7Y43_18350 [Sphingomonas sp. 28-62-20]|uniref:hypothetical protein n=1 Tax=Sphingomonas sp. 28-62-20 TaxID=1970433 RepID=UPI000BC9FB11|nr:MAG: hypothetical protein B7Y43_18350 [Sphingomonas sp. 28-62-20]